MTSPFKTFAQKVAALDTNGIYYTSYNAVNGNTGIYWMANGNQGTSVYAPDGECIGEWDMYIINNPDTDPEPEYAFRPATYTDHNMNGAAICTAETRHWTECRQEAK